MYQRVTYSDFTPTLGDLVKQGVPIFNDWWNTVIPEYKSRLEDKIVKHYYFQQIGVETPDRFVFQLNAHLQEIMPYYNQMYESELIKINPIMNHFMQTEGRSIENLLGKVNTSDDKYAKSIRDFVGMTDRSSHGTSQTVGDVHGTANSKTTGTYHKDGDEHTDDVNADKRVIDSMVTENQNTDKTFGEHTTDNTDTNQTTDTTKDVTENPGQISTKKMDWGQTETGTKNVVGNVKSTGDGTKNWTETTDDDSTTDTTTNLKESSNSSAEKDYTDTPQIRLDVDDKGNQVVRKDYLTNVTWDNSSSSHNADTTQNQKYADDMTKDHKEDTTDNNNTDSTEDTTDSKQKGGTDTETVTMSGQNKTNTVGNEKGTTDTDRVIDKSGNENENMHGTTQTNTTDNLNGDRDIDKKWNEDGVSSSTKDDVTHSHTTGNNQEDTQGTEQNRENADVTQTSVGNTEKTSEETTDKGTSETMQGFMNVSASALLEAFRKTFLNIDQMIIEELQDNFMLVY